MEIKDYGFKSCPYHAGKLCPEKTNKSQDEVSKIIDFIENTCGCKLLAWQKEVIRARYITAVIRRD